DWEAVAELRRAVGPDLNRRTPQPREAAKPETDAGTEARSARLPPGAWSYPAGPAVAGAPRPTFRRNRLGPRCRCRPALRLGQSLRSGSGAPWRSPSGGVGVADFILPGLYSNRITRPLSSGYKTKEFPFGSVCCRIYT